MTSAPWPAPVARDRVDVDVEVPGSKSMTARALVLAGLADGPSVLHRPLRARDTLLMASGLAALGVEVVDAAAGGWRVAPGRLRGPARVDCGLAGTVARFLPPVAALARGPVHFDGDPRARVRPLAPLLAALRALGVTVDDDRGGLPLTVTGRGRVPGGPVRLDASASSQFVSGLLLSAARFDRGATVRHVGPPLPSGPHVAMTVSMVRAAGGRVDESEPDAWRVDPGPLHGTTWDIEPDLSNAAPFLAAALVTGGQVRLPGWPVATTQAGDALRELLALMGADVHLDEDGLRVTGSGRILGLDADLGRVGELVPVIAALAAMADSPSHLRGIGHLRGHETDRLAALAREIAGLGGDVTETADGLELRPRPLHAGTFATYDDHRLATAAAVLGLAVPGVLVENIETTAKTLPGFPDRWARMLGAAP